MQICWKWYLPKEGWRGVLKQIKGVPLTCSPIGEYLSHPLGTFHLLFGISSSFAWTQPKTSKAQVKARLSYLWVRHVVKCHQERNSESLYSNQTNHTDEQFAKMQSILDQSIVLVKRRVIDKKCVKQGDVKSQAPKTHDIMMLWRCDQSLGPWPDMTWFMAEDWPFPWCVTILQYLKNKRLFLFSESEK